MEVVYSDEQIKDVKSLIDQAYQLATAGNFDDALPVVLRLLQTYHMDYDVRFIASQVYHDRPEDVITLSQSDNPVNRYVAAHLLGDNYPGVRTMYQYAFDRGLLRAGIVPLMLHDTGLRYPLSALYPIYTSKGCIDTYLYTALIMAMRGEYYRAAMYRLLEYRIWPCQPESPGYISLTNLFEHADCWRLWTPTNDSFQFLPSFKQQEMICWLLVANRIGLGRYLALYTLKMLLI